ncbi:hypothetical protein Vadar_014444 [Vaccinium darrowii]|uniref:Uncharacterized protein n=1 Tax=Vaccinium darrowii TaxID=229202 RepID=A0ACB7XQQ7_9ERIC|nr:hypothetical protein Vadar_014444 [Vaccinium darrowii]
MTQRSPTMAKMAETIRTLQEKSATVETKQYEFEQEGSQTGDDDELAKQLKDIRVVLTMSHGDIFLDFEGLQFFPKAQLPKRFKMPNIEKFIGTENSSSHVRLVINTLKPMGLIDEFIAQLFQQTLIGNTLDWFLKLRV